MQNPSSFDRIVTYFHALARSTFTFQGVEYAPYNQLVVSEKAFRSYTCPEGCGACCMRCSLVWDEPSSYAAERALFSVNGVVQEFYQDAQEDNADRYCKHLVKPAGRCGIYLDRPLPCRFELFKFVHGVSASTARAMVRLPGRAWNLTRTDGKKGALCEIIPYDEELTKTHIRDLRIIKKWMDGFNIENDCDTVLKYLETGPHQNSLTISRRPKGGLL